MEGWRKGEEMRKRRGKARVEIREGRVEAARVEGWRKWEEMRKRRGMGR